MRATGSRIGRSSAVEFSVTVLDDTVGKGMVVKLKFRGWKLASIATVEAAWKKTN